MISSTGYYTDCWLSSKHLGFADNTQFCGNTLKISHICKEKGSLGVCHVAETADRSLEGWGPIHEESLIHPAENTWLCSAQVFDIAL